MFDTVNEIHFESLPSSPFAGKNYSSNSKNNFCELDDYHYYYNHDSPDFVKKKTYYEIPLPAFRKSLEEQQRDLALKFEEQEILDEAQQQQQEKDISKQFSEDSFDENAEDNGSCDS